MIGTVIGVLAGFLAAVLPSAFTAVGEWFEHRKDMDQGAQTIAAAGAGVTVPLRAVSASASVVAPRVDPTVMPPLFARLFATLRASVRPVVTYGFFALFVFIKCQGMMHGYYVDHTSALLLLPVLWDEGTQALFATVLAFWFGSRAIEKQQVAANDLANAANAGNGRVTGETI